MSIPPALIEPLSLKIAGIFELTEVDAVLKNTAGERLYNLAPRGLTDPETISAMLDRISAQGIEDAVLGQMLARRPEDAQFADLVGQAAPGARMVPATTEANVASLVQGLDAVRSRLDDPAIRAALSSSREGLRAIATNIDRLDAYKSLHECLHQLQVKQFSALRDAARHLPDPAQAAELRVFRNQLRNACLFAGEAANRLPDTELVRRTELLWIDDLAKAGDDFHKAIHDRNGEDARRALSRIARIMRKTPPRLNTLIFARATELPLDNLAKALEQVAAAGADGTVASALQALRLLIPAIHARVVEHKEWQDADELIAELDQLVERSSPRLIEEFAEAWMELKAAVLELTSHDPGAKWATELEADIRSVDDSLAAETADDRFLADFSVFRGNAQYNFLVVDSRLKTDCTELVKIGEPLNRILSELGA